MRLDWRSLLERTGFVLTTVALLLLGLFQGFQPFNLELDLFFVAVDILLIEAAASSMFFTVFVTVSGLIFFSKTLRSSDPGKFSGKGEKVTCIIPNYYDSEVVGRAVRSILDSGYADLEVLVVCVEGDSESIEKMEKLSEKEDRVDYVVNDKKRSSKSENVNRGIRESDSDLIAIFDADQVVKTGFFSKAVSLMDSYDVVQGRHLPVPEGFVSSLAYYESFIFDYIARQLSYLITDFRLAGSNCMLAKRKVFDQVGDYDKNILTEDFDFSHRCYKNKIDVKNIQTPVTDTEASHSLKDWWGQRKRWMTGYFQVFMKLSIKALTDFKGYRSILSLVICAASLLGSLFMLTLVSKFVILLLLGAEIIYTIPVAMVMLLGLTGRILDFRGGNVESIGLNWALTPLIFPFFSLITVKAFFEFVLHKDKKWYRVEKG